MSPELQSLASEVVLARAIQDPYLLLELLLMGIPSRTYRRKNGDKGRVVNPRCPRVSRKGFQTRARPGCNRLPVDYHLSTCSFSLSSVLAYGLVGIAFPSVHLIVCVFSHVWHGPSYPLYVYNVRSMWAFSGFTVVNRDFLKGFLGESSAT